MMLTQLPATVTSALGSMQWPLIQNNPPPTPMYYATLDAMKSIREKQQQHSQPILEKDSEVLRSDETLSPEGYQLSLGMFDAIDSLGGSDHARVAVGLILLGNGGMDECHDLVLPLSWATETDVGYGPPKPDSPAAAEASYAHALVHRREGSNVGEFGFTGFKNADFWTKTPAFRRGLKEQVMVEPFQNVRDAVWTCAQGNKEAERWCEEDVTKALKEGETWHPRVLNKLCAQVADGGGDVSEEMRFFVQRASLAELDVLLQHCLGKAGVERDLGDSASAPAP